MTADAPPGQGNNAYVFPGIGLGAVACRARTLPDELFLAAARTLAALVQQQRPRRGALYPPLRDIRKISLAIAVSVADKAYEMGLARAKRPANLRKSIEAMITALINDRWDPVYLDMTNRCLVEKHEANGGHQMLLESETRIDPFSIPARWLGVTGATTTVPYTPIICDGEIRSTKDGDPSSR